MVYALLRVFQSLSRLSGGEELQGRLFDAA